MSKAAGQLKGRAARLTRLMPAGPSNAARTPFVLLVVLLLGGGLITLLVLNSALNEGSFRLSELKKRTTDLTDEQQALQRDVDSSAEPDALARRARELGMVPGGSPVFLGPDGKVRGVPSAATSEPAPEPPQKTAAPPQPPASAATPSGSPAPGAPTPSGSAATGPSTSAAGPDPAAPSTPAAPRTPADQTSSSPGR
ncbi:septum formation initiator [Streptomyces sp. NPDC088727]|uniref:septum formation initiator n=1 Tax=Streptomyces sp. NPDC088727 TaxID=3365875 RepID=UPI0037F76682